jgi:serine/threonine-protein kinase RsbW
MPLGDFSRNQDRSRALRLNVTLDSRVQSADVAESMIIEFSMKLGCGDRECEEIALAVRESVINAVLHGNHSDMSKKVVLTASLENTALTICVRDEGEGFDPDSLPDPLVPDNLLNESGRGFFILRTCMDNVTVQRSPQAGTELKMVKYLARDSSRFGRLR